MLTTDNRITINGITYTVIKSFASNSKANEIDMKRFDVECNNERNHLIVVTSHSIDKLKMKVIDEMLGMHMQKAKDIPYLRKLLSKDKKKIDKNTIEYYYLYTYFDSTYIPLNAFIEKNPSIVTDEKVIHLIIRQVLLIATDLDQKHLPTNKLIDLEHIYLKEVAYLDYDVYIEVYTPDYLYKAKLSLLEGTDRYYSYIKQTEISNFSLKENKQLDRNYYGILYENQNFVWSIGALAYYLSTKRTLIYSDTRLYFNKSTPVSKKFFDFLLQCLNTDHSRRVLLSELCNLDFIANYDYSKDNPKKSSVFQSSSSFMKSATILEPVDDDPFFECELRPKLNLAELYKKNYDKSILSMAMTFKGYDEEEENKNKIDEYIEEKLFNKEKEEIEALNEGIKTIYLPDNITDYY